MKNTLYIYLARLDKKGIKVLVAFEYAKKVYPTKIKNINELNLNKEILNKVIKQSHDNRMEYVLYAETAISFDELKSSLHNRGYMNLPLQQFTGYVVPTSINEKVLTTISSTMLKRKSELKQ
jgi:hypothetical protein